MKILKSEQTILDYLKVNSPYQVLFTFPYRYEVNKITPFSSWKKDERVFFNAILLNKPKVAYFNKINVAHFEVSYDNQIIKCSIYNRKWISNLKAGSSINLIGKYSGNNKVVVSNYNNQPLEKQLGYHGVYTISNKINLNTYQKFVKKIFVYYYDVIENIIPESLIVKYQLLDLKVALKYIHFPKNEKQILLAKRTLKYQELLLFNFSNLLDKHANTLSKKAKVFDHNQVFKLANSLHFNLTNDQLAAVNDILSDFEENVVKKRLILGDVGSGKTIVAALAMYASVLSNYQAALMVPTEILAIQHYEFFKKIFKKFDVKVYCLYANLKPFKKQAILDAIKNEDNIIVIGTHSLISDNIKFKKLGVTVIDELQRFGVNQRETLLNKGYDNDLILMSATPIPRTLASVLYSDLDISFIKQLPNYDKVVVTKYINENSMRSILPEILNKIKENNQVYVVCPAIEDNVDFEAKNTTTIYNNLNKFLNVDNNYNIKLEMLHGKLDKDEKVLVMDKFIDKKIDILVTTTVIEVGIDVKSANIMVIYDADRFGLSQLHQLRGRVGRGSEAGYCYLLSSKKEIEVVQRLQFLENTNDGFEISKYDLEKRGPGDLYGVKQSGFLDFAFVDLNKDEIMLKYALADAKEIVNNLNNNENKKIINYIKEGNNDNF